MIYQTSTEYLQLWISQVHHCTWTHVWDRTKWNKLLVCVYYLCYLSVLYLYSLSVCLICVIMKSITCVVLSVFCLCVTIRLFICVAYLCDVSVLLLCRAGAKKTGVSVLLFLDLAQLLVTQTRPKQSQVCVTPAWIFYLSVQFYLCSFCPSLCIFFLVLF